MSNIYTLVIISKGQHNVRAGLTSYTYRHGAGQETEMKFMQFWFMANLALKDRGQPELTYGPARDLWSIYKEKNWALA